MSFSSTCAGIVEKRLGPNLHHGKVSSVAALQLKGSSADGEFEKVGQRIDWGLLRSIHQASESVKQWILGESRLPSSHRPDRSHDMSQTLVIDDCAIIVRRLEALDNKIPKFHLVC